MTLAAKGIKNHRYNEKSNQYQYEVLVSWKGLDDEDDSWEPMAAMFADIKFMMTKYLQNELAKKPNAKLKSFIESCVVCLEGGVVLGGY